MKETLVLGLGNILLRDEGVGVRVIEHLLDRYEFPEGVWVMDGGTLGLELLPFLKRARRLLVVDSVQARKKPGTLVRLAKDEIPTFLDASKVSPHQEGLQDLLAVAMLKGYLPEEVVFWGAQVGTMGVGLDLSPAVTAQVEALADRVLTELRQWGIEPRPKEQAPQGPGKDNGGRG